MRKSGKKFAAARQQVPPRPHTIEDAVPLMQKVKFAKFDETVELAMRLGVDPKHADQMVRGTVVLPHGLGRTKRVLAIAGGEKQKEAQEAGADVVVGSHAHILLGGGYLRGAYVHYGLGNFVFSASRDATRATGVLNLTLTDGVVSASTWTPARITDSIPQPLDPDSAAAASAQWESLRDCTGLSPVPG